MCQKKSNELSSKIANQSNWDDVLFKKMTSCTLNNLIDKVCILELSKTSGKKPAISMKAWIALLTSSSPRLKWRNNKDSQGSQYSQDLAVHVDNVDCHGHAVQAHALLKDKYAITVVNSIILPKCAAQKVSQSNKWAVDHSKGHLNKQMSLR